MLLLNQLLLWGKKVNLTAIKKPNEVVTKHLLDSLAMLPLVQEYQAQFKQEKLSILDVGTGAVFIRRMAMQLKLSNVDAIHTRIQDLNPEQPYSIVTARAFADVNDLLTWLPEDCVDTNTEVLAMKGRLPEEELSQLKDSLLSSKWKLLKIIDLDVPGLNADRCVLRLSKNNAE